VRYGICPECLKRRGLKPHFIPRHTEAELLATHHRQVQRTYLWLMLVTFALGMALGDIVGEYSTRLLHPCPAEKR
jgi:hypothetical protein